MHWNGSTWNAGTTVVDLFPPDVTAEMVDVLQYVDAHFRGSSTLEEAFPGGIHFSRNHPNPQRPYLLVDVISEVPDFTTEELYAEVVGLQFTIVADNLPSARLLRTLLSRDTTAGLDRISGEPLGDSGTIVTVIRTGGVVTLDPDPGPTGGPVVLSTLDYVFLLSRD
jgi:hypothetical protein